MYMKYKSSDPKKLAIEVYSFNKCLLNTYYIVVCVTMMNNKNGYSCVRELAGRKSQLQSSVMGKPSAL